MQLVVGICWHYFFVVRLSNRNAHVGWQCRKSYQRLCPVFIVNALLFIVVDRRWRHCWTELDFVHSLGRTLSERLAKNREPERKGIF